MANYPPSSFPNDSYHCPDHFGFERQHQGALVAWAVGLLSTLFLLGSLASRLRADAHAEPVGPVPETAASVLP